MDSPVDRPRSPRLLHECADVQRIPASTTETKTCMPLADTCALEQGNLRVWSTNTRDEPMVEVVVLLDNNAAGVATDAHADLG